MALNTTDKNDPNYSILNDPNYEPETEIGKKLKEIHDKKRKTYGKIRDNQLKTVEELSTVFNEVKQYMKPRKAKRFEENLDAVKTLLDFDVQNATPTNATIKKCLDKSNKIINSCVAEINTLIDEIQNDANKAKNALNGLNEHVENVKPSGSGSGSGKSQDDGDSKTK